MLLLVLNERSDERTALFIARWPVGATGSDDSTNMLGIDGRYAYFSGLRRVR